MEDELKWRPLRIGYALAFCILLIAAFFVSSIDHFCSTKKAKEVSAQNDLIQIVNAIRNFRVDYGSGPQISDSGFIKTEEANAELIRTLIGNDERRNPRQIRYLETPKAHAREGVYKRGIHPGTGAWIDPLGGTFIESESPLENHEFRIHTPTTGRAI